MISMMMLEERTVRSSYKTWQTDKAKLKADFFVQAKGST